MAVALLRLEQVAKSYAGPDGPLEVLRGIDLEVAPGSSLAVTGPSGSGKSTLLNLIGGLDLPTRGRVWLDGADLAAHTEDERCAIRSRDIGFVFQRHHLLPQFTVLENVLLSAAARQPPDPAAAARAGRLLARVGLEGRLRHRPGELSGGERQRVAVVRALVNRPRLLLADEPTGALDRANAEALAQLLTELQREEGVALVVATHAEALAARMERVLRLRDGRLALREEGR